MHVTEKVLQEEAMVFARKTEIVSLLHNKLANIMYKIIVNVLTRGT